jgi:uncharacterized protein YrrD
MKQPPINFLLNHLIKKGIFKSKTKDLIEQAINSTGHRWLPVLNIPSIMDKQILNFAKKDLETPLH